MTEKTYDVEVWGESYPLRMAPKNQSLWWNIATHTWLGRGISYEKMKEIQKLCWASGRKIEVTESSTNLRRLPANLQPGQQTLKVYV